VIDPTGYDLLRCTDLLCRLIARGDVVLREVPSARLAQLVKLLLAIPRVPCVRRFLSKRDMRAIILAFATGMDLAATSAAAATRPAQEKWYPFGAALSSRLGDQACGDGCHQTLWRGWRANW